MTIPRDPNTIDALPTKELFIDMLTKDLNVSRAILDLVDNSVDAAKRLRGKDERLEGIVINIKLSPEEFSIMDNCGGMSVKAAREYAFRFGRPTDVQTEKTPGSVGQFGVGMKRALFKIGRRFVVSSKTPVSWFLIDVDVEEWKRKSREYNFQFSKIEEPLGEEGKKLPIGTIIKVTDLNSDVKGQFGLTNYVTKLIDEIKAAQSPALELGITITVNSTPVRSYPVTLLVSQKMQISHIRKTVKSDNDIDISIDIYAGLANSAGKNSGWTVFCNGRAVLESNKQDITGWGETEGSSIPRYHHQFALFHGYVYLDSEDTSALPWNTTKTGIDEDSQLWRFIRIDMISAMRPVISFLNELKDERSYTRNGSRTQIVATSQAKPISLVRSEGGGEEVPNQAALFKVEVAEARMVEKLKNISYQRPEDRFNKVLKSIGASSAKELGEMTFEYYYEMEIGQ